MTYTRDDGAGRGHAKPDASETPRERVGGGGCCTHVSRIQPATRCCRAPKVAAVGLFPCAGSKGSGDPSAAATPARAFWGAGKWGGGMSSDANSLEVHFAPPPPSERLKIRCNIVVVDEFFFFFFPHFRLSTAARRLCAAATITAVVIAIFAFDARKFCPPTHSSAARQPLNR